MDNWIEVYGGLDPPLVQTSPQSGDVYSVKELLKSAIWLGKDQHSRPAFLVAARPDSADPGLSVDLPNLRVQHNCRVTLYQDGASQGEAEVSLLSCQSDDNDLQSLFLSAVGNALPLGPQAMSRSGLESVVAHLIELFRASEAAATGTVVGLWGELFLISECENPDEWLAAWHSEPTERFDFSRPDERLEVKTTLDETRRHMVSLEQLVDEPDRPGYLISIQTREMVGGLSLNQLWRTAVDRVRSSELRAKLDEQILKTLGRDWTLALDRRFDDALARSSIRVVQCANVPRVSGVPTEVSAVRFLVDLSGVSPLDWHDSSRKSLLAGLIPSSS